jgi:hypothetical protein
MRTTTLDLNSPTGLIKAFNHYSVEPWCPEVVPLCHKHTTGTGAVGFAIRFTLLKLVFSPVYYRSGVLTRKERPWHHLNSLWCISLLLWRSTCFSFGIKRILSKTLNSSVSPSLLTCSVSFHFLSMRFSTAVSVAILASGAMALPRFTKDDWDSFVRRQNQCNDTQIPRLFIPPPPPPGGYPSVKIPGKCCFGCNVSILNLKIKF